MAQSILNLRIDAIKQKIKEYENNKQLLTESSLNIDNLLESERIVKNNYSNAESAYNEYNLRLNNFDVQIDDFNKQLIISDDLLKDVRILYSIKEIEKQRLDLKDKRTSNNLFGARIPL